MYSTKYFVELNLIFSLGLGTNGLTWNLARKINKCSSGTSPSYLSSNVWIDHPELSTYLKKLTQVEVAPRFWRQTQNLKRLLILLSSFISPDERIFQMAMPQNFSAKKYVIQTFLTFTLEEAQNYPLVFFFCKSPTDVTNLQVAFWQTISLLTGREGKYCVNFCTSSKVKSNNFFRFY